MQFRSLNADDKPDLGAFGDVCLHAGTDSLLLRAACSVTLHGPPPLLEGCSMAWPPAVHTEAKKRKMQSQLTRTYIEKLHPTATSDNDSSAPITQAQFLPHLSNPTRLTMTSTPNSPRPDVNWKESSILEIPDRETT